MDFIPEREFLIDKAREKKIRFLIQI